MDIIATHPSADLDALASVMAARLLYPGAQAVLAQGLARGARELARLHRDRFPWITPAEVDPASVRRLVLVDVRRASRLHALDAVLARAEDIEIDVWDHHPGAPDDVRADHVFVAAVGSAVTLLVEEMQARAIAVDPVEATLFALGIHADTGSLLHPGTTARDAQALAWLLARGASLRVIERFLRLPFSAVQRAALTSALERIEEHRAAGRRIAIATIDLESSMEGLDEIATELFRVLRPHALALVALEPARGRAHVIARGAEGAIDVAAMLAPLGGGGHASAAAVSLSRARRDDVLARLHASIDALPPLVPRVREVMSSPVHTIAPDRPLGAVVDDLARLGCGGMPVVRDGVLVGMITRDDLARAEREGRMHLTAASCMAHAVRTIDPDAPVDDAFDAMATHGVGRLPVVRDGALVGIVSRRDVRRVLYGGS